MSLDFATQLTAVATTVLAVFAIVTAGFAFLAFRKQSAEVRAIEQQVALQSEQFAARRLADAVEAEVLHFQAEDIRASQKQRERDADDRRQSQAAKVTAWFTTEQWDSAVDVWGARIRNASDLPVLDVRVFFHYVQEQQPGGQWASVLRGESPETIRVLPPGHDRFAKIPDQVRDMLDQVDDTIYVVSIQFTDAAGNRWERGPRGELVLQT
jgi:hypothetical protein